MDLRDNDFLGAFSNHPSGRIVDLNGFVRLVAWSTCRVDLSGRPDGVHFDAAAPDTIAAWLAPQLDLSESKPGHVA